MCNAFSGLIVAEKGKDWGKVLFLSGVHHEKDREKIKSKYGDNVLAWESNEPYQLDKFEFTHAINVSEKEQKELLELLVEWGKKQDKEKLIRSMITVIKDNKPTDDYLVNENLIKIGDNMSIICDFSANIEAGDESTQTAGYRSTQTAGYRSTQTAGDESTQKAGYGSTQKAGDKSTQTAGNESTQKAGNGSTQKAGYGSTQKAGYWSTQTAGDESTQKAGYWSTQTAGDESTQTAGYWSTQTAGDNSNCIIHGDTSYIVLNGKNVLLTQIYEEDGIVKRRTLVIDELFKKYKKGDKIKIVKGKSKRTRK